MRATYSPLLPLIAAVCLASACAADPPPAPAAPEAASSDGDRGAAAPPVAPPSNEESGWVGDQKSTEQAPASATEDPPADDGPSADGKGPETRTMDVIRARVLANRKAARKCYEDARKDDKDLQGNVVIHFVLAPEGKVKSAELNRERSTLKAPAVTECVITVIKGIDFPKSSRGMETSANYPFNFTP